MKLCFMLLANLKCSLSDYKAGAAIPYTLIRWTRKAAESSNFQIMTYHASLWQQDLLFTFFFFLGQSCPLAIRAATSSRCALIYLTFLPLYGILIPGLLGWCVIFIYLSIFNSPGLFSGWKGQSVRLEWSMALSKTAQGRWGSRVITSIHLSCAAFLQPL